MQSRTKCNAQSFLRAICCVGVLFAVFRSLGSTRNEVSVDVGYVKRGIPSVILSKTFTATSVRAKSDRLFYIIDVPEATDWLVGNHTMESVDFYSSALNEDQGEIWLHRGFVNMKTFRTMNQSAADIILIPSYLHLLRKIRGLVAGSRTKKAELKQYLYPSLDELVNILLQRIVDPRKPHVLLLPTTNPKTSRLVGVAKVTSALRNHGVNLFALGYERNTFWQHISPDRILPIPYVLKLSENDSVSTIHGRDEKDTQVFYAGDSRRNAFGWSGCNRSMVLPLSTMPGVDIHLFDGNSRREKDSRLTQAEYNQRMRRCSFCLLLCGDTPSSRSLTSAIWNGCIPIRVGSRLRGWCEPPCRTGWGWTLSNGSSHLPYHNSGKLPWDLFPELSEASFVVDPVSVMNDFLASVTDDEISKWNDFLQDAKESFVYGWGSPVNSTLFGKAIPAIWISLLQLIERG